MMMDEFSASMGTSASLCLRVLQAGAAVASLLFMCLTVEFYNYTSFCFLVTIMGLIVPWSFTLGAFDVASIFIRRPANAKPGMLLMVVVGDWVLALLSLAASSSSAGVSSLLIDSRALCHPKLCARFQLSAAMAFMSWLLSFASALFNLWTFIAA